jgi:hypothetical protein
MADAMNRTITTAVLMHNDQATDRSADQPGLQPRSKRKRALLLVGALVLVGILAGAYCTYWRIVARQLEAGVEAWVRQERARGNEIAFGWDGIGGFPLRFAATFRDPALRWRGPRGEIVWQGPAVEAEMAPWDLRRIEVVSLGQHDAALHLAGGAGEWRVAAIGLAGTIWLYRSGALRGFTLALRQPDVTPPNGAALASADATIMLDQPETPPTDYEMPLARIALEAHTIALPEGARLLTDDPIEVVSLDATINGPMPMAPLREALTAWRDAGGTVELSEFKFAQGPLGLRGNGTLALDAALQPEGAGTVTSSGLSEAIEILIRDGLIPSDRALIARTTTKALERPATNGTLQATFGLTLQNRTVSFGPVPLFALQPIEWP